MFGDHDRKTSSAHSGSRARRAIPWVRSLVRGAMLAAVLALLLGALLTLASPQAGAQTPAKSTDATLARWEWRTANGAVNIDHCWPQWRGDFLNLQPAFTASNTVYAQTVTYRHTHVAVKAIANDDGATITFSRGSTSVPARDAKQGFGNSQRPVNGCHRTVGDQDVTGIKYTNAIALDSGTTSVSVTVTAEDGTTTKTYTATITRGIGISFSIDGKLVSHPSLYEAISSRGILVEEGGTFTMSATLTGPAPQDIPIMPRVFLARGNTDQTHRGNAEFSDLGAGTTKHQIQTPGGFHYAQYDPLSFETGESGSKSVTVTLPEDDDRQTDSFVIEFQVLNTHLVQTESNWPRQGIIIRDNDAPNAPRNLVVTPGVQSLKVKWDPPTGSDLPRIGGTAWNGNLWYERSDNRAITLDGYEVQYRESRAPNSDGTPGNPSTGWTTAARHFTYQHFQINTPAKNNWTIRHLKPNTSYDVRVRALNRDEYSDWAEAPSASTPRGGDFEDRSQDKIGWTATLTAGQTRHAFGIGCLFWADTSSEVPCADQTIPVLASGGLEPSTFNFWYNGRQIRVNGLYRIDSHVDWFADPFREQLQRLDLNLSHPLPGDRDIRLRIGGVGGLEFKLSAGSNGGGNYRWNLPGFFWETGNVTKVELIEVMSATRAACANCQTGFAVTVLSAPKPQEAPREPESDSGPETTPGPETEPKTTPDPQPKSTPDPQPKTTPDPQPDPQTNPQPDPQPDPQPQPQPSQQPDPQPQPQIQAQTAQEPEPEPDPLPELSDLAKEYDADGNRVIDINEYVKAARDYASSTITLEQFTAVKDAWIEGTRKDLNLSTKLKTTNRPPTVDSAFNDLTLTHQGDSQQISTSGRFSDPDGHTITAIEAASSAKSVASVAMASDDSSLTLTGRSSGTATITVTAHDGHNGRVQDTFTVTVKAAPTVASAIADISSLATGTSQDVALASVFSDPDGDALTLSASSSASTVATVSVATDGSKLTVAGIARGTATITVNARDSDGNEVSDSFDVTVIQPNQAPTVASAIDDATIVKTSGTHEVTLSSVFADADTDDTLTITAKSSKTSVATVSVASDGSKLTVTAKSRGSATIIVTASDGEAEVSDTFKVKVKAAPTVASAISDISSLAAEELHQISVSNIFSDADGDTLTYSVASTDEDTAAAYVLLTDLYLLTVKPGKVTITLTAQDSDGNKVSDAFDVTVTPANKAPTVASAISDVTIPNTSGTKQVSLSGVFSDADGDSLTITAKSSKTSVATVSVASDGSNLTVTAKSRGSATITVTASDGKAEVSDTFTVKVKAAPAVASAIADIGSLKARASQQISLAGVFSDADGDALTLSAASSDSSVVTVSEQLDPETASATAITVTAVTSGTATITVTARDADGNEATDAFDVTVPAQQQERVVTLPGPVGDLTLTDEGGSVVVSWTAPTLGSAPTRYIVHLKPEGGEAGRGKTKTPKAKKTKVTFDSLEAGQTYKVWIRAQNQAGKGERVHATISLPSP
jgi:hypothetical protein